ncbi:mitochondrial glycoprotein, partial [Phlegmacium glaucopus]
IVDTLDVAVQDEFEMFLQERGINASVASFIPEYAAHKEQQEYVKWLGKVKNFIDL